MSIAIAPSYEALAQYFGMPRRPKRSVLDRALEAAREKLGKEKATQADVGKLAGGLSQPSVSDWANSAPRIENAITFALATNICVEWLYTERGPKRPIDLADPELAWLSQAWPSLPEITKGRILQLAEDNLPTDSTFRRRA